MLRVPVVSSNIRYIGYDPSTATLEVEFHNGGMYHYFGVPASVHQSLMNAASKGGYLESHIKNVYRYQRV